MSRWSRYYEDNVLDHMLRGEPFAPPRTVYAGLFIISPAEESEGVEVSGSGYRRVELDLVPALDGITANASDLTWPRALEDWGTILAIGIFDAERGGDMLAWAELRAKRGPAHSIVTEGDKLEVMEGEFAISLA